MVKEIGLQESGPFDGSGHNHGEPSPHTITTLIREDIRAVVIADPSKIAADLQKGNFCLHGITWQKLKPLWMKMQSKYI